MLQLLLSPIHIFVSDNYQVKNTTTRPLDVDYFCSIQCTNYLDIDFFCMNGYSEINYTV